MNGKASLAPEVKNVADQFDSTLEIGDGAADCGKNQAQHRERMTAGVARILAQPSSMDLAGFP